MTRKLLPICVLTLAASLFATTAFAAPTFTIQNIKNTCGGQSNGSFDVVVTAVTGGSSLRFEIIILDPAPITVIDQTIPMPAFPYTFSVTNRIAGDYVIRVRTDGGPPPLLAAPQLLTLTDFTVVLDGTTDNFDVDCSGPDGTISVTTNGSSSNGAITYSWAGPGGPYTTEDLTGLRGGDYTLTYTDGTTTSCTLGPIHINDPVPAAFTISSADPALCAGDVLLVDVSVSTVPYTYDVVEGVTVLASAAGNGGLLTIPVPGLAVGNHTLKVQASAGCTPVFNNAPDLSVVVDVVPTIALDFTNPQVCSGATSANITYGITTGTPNQYSIDFDVTAEGQLFVDVVNQALPSSPIVITVPAGAAANTYNANLTVRNSVTGCVSAIIPITVTVNPNPTITPGPNPSVCAGVTTANFTYGGLAGGGNQYSINFDLAAEGQLFVDVPPTALPASPIPIVVPAAAAPATYNATLRIINSVTNCFTDYPITVTVVANPTITLGANPQVCAGTTSANLTYTATTANEYSITFDATALGQGFVNVAFTALAVAPSQIAITVPAGATPQPYNANLTIRNTATTCTTVMPIQVIINPLPTIAAVVDPQVCLGATTANLTYGVTTNSPNQYSIDFDAAAQTAGFLDVTNAAFAPPTAIVITIPGTATAGTYNGNITVRNSTTGCVSIVEPIQVIINPNPTITPGANPSVCAGVTTANLSYAGLAGGGDQYSINFNVTAEGQGFVDVLPTALPASPIAITIPAAAAPGTYNATLRIINSATTCFTDYAITVTVVANPTITLGANPQVCSGTTSANLTYSATTANEYSLDFDAAANAQGFGDVALTALPGAPSQIVIVVPGGAATGVYNANLTIRNSATTCTTVLPITVTINPLPTITAVVDPQVCLGATTANLTYGATTNSPNQYSIDFDAAAQTAGFLDITNAAFAPPAAIVVNIPGTAAAGTYNGNLTVRNSVTGCVSTIEAVQIIVNLNPTITPGPNPSVCSGVTTANLTYAGLAGGGNQYSINFDAAAEAQSFVDVPVTALPASPIAITVPVAAVPAIYNATLRIINSGTTCFTDYPITVTVVANPTITLGANPQVCLGAASANLTYTATTANEYSIDFDATAQGQGFVDVALTALAGAPSQIAITIPGGAVTGTYDANLTIRNSATTCTTILPIQVTINPNPTLTPGANPSVCAGATTANLTYAGLVGGNQYSINFDITAEGQGFTDVAATALPASPIPIPVPAAAAPATYNATLRIITSATGCFTDYPITVTVEANPTITLGANPQVCAGTTTANLTYSATTANEYSIAFDATAQGQGFVDVAFTALAGAPSQIVITVPGGATPQPYNANLTIRNSVTTCTTVVPIQVIINPNPTIAAVVDPQVCLGATTANLTYGATTGSPNQYSIDFDGAAETAGFIDVVNAAFAPPTAIVITIPGGATAGTYNGDLVIRNSVTGCVSVVEPIQVIINPNPTITPGANPSVCSGILTVDFAYAGLAGGGNQYSIDFDLTAEGQLFADVAPTALPASPIAITVPVAAAPATYNAILRIINSATTCFTDYPITVTVVANPTISLGANPQVCAGTTVANLTYTATTGDEYSIGFDATALGEGFNNVAFTALAAGPSQIAITVPAGAIPQPYNANLTIRNSVTTCTTVLPIQVIIDPNPTISLDFNDPEACSGNTSTAITYGVTSGSPDQFSIDFDAAAEAQLFVDVVNSALTASPITIVVPAAGAVGTYNADLTVRNGTTGCVSAIIPITVTINANPTITLGASPSVCQGTTTANLPYTATTAGADQYMIDFDATAEGAGFADVAVTALLASPIAITVPALAAVGIYNAAIRVSNSTTGCFSTLNAFTITVGADITLGAISPVCINSNASIPYSATIGAPDIYSIDFDATAEGAGFVDVTDAALSPTPITVTVPAGIAGIFNASLTVKNNATGCVSAIKPISLVIGTTITLGASPSICSATPTADLTYTSTTGSPDQYSIAFDAAAQTAGFVDVTNAALTASPIVIVVSPAAGVGTYNYTVSVRNSTTGCGSLTTAKTITIDANATANAGADQTICVGATYFLVGSSIGNAASTGAWSIFSQPSGGDGSLSTTAAVANPATVSFSATVAGAYTLRLSTDDPAGTCLPATDDVVISITPVPVVLAGQTKTVCGQVDLEILMSPLNQPPNTVFNWPDPDGTGPASAGVNVVMGPAGTIHISDVLANATLADVQVVYQVTPSVGSCQGTQEDIVVTVRTAPELVMPQTKTICSGDNVNYEILIAPANTPAGVVFSWPDPDGAGSGTSQLNIPADPAGTAHITDVLYNGTGAPIHVLYSIIATSPSGCRGIPRDVDITVNPGAVVEAGTAQSICATGTATLAGSSIGGLATVGTWSILSSPAGGDGVLSSTSPTANPSSVTFTATIPGDYTLRLTTDDPAGSCVFVADDVVVTVRTLNDPACAGLIVGTGDCTTVLITPKPSPATCTNSDGSIIFTIKPFVPAVLTTEVRIDIQGVSPTNSTIARTVHNDSTFNGLPVGLYDYTVEYGDPSCIKTGQVAIDRSGTVGVPTFTNKVDPICFGPPSGKVTINVPNEAGNPLQWSVDGTNWNLFIAGNVVTGIPGGTNIIAVRRNASDVCASGATLTLADPTQITTTVTAANATCANDDGSITLTAVTGGTGPYSFTLNGTAIVVPASNVITGLTAAPYVLGVTDAVGCSRTFNTTISFPGYINHSVPVVVDPDCAGGGTNGIISLQITDVGSYQFGITTDPVAEPTTYNNAGGSQITINNLTNGIYAVWLKPVGTGTQCATKIGDLAVDGVYPVSYQSTHTDVICLSDKGTILLTSISGAPAIGYTYSLTNTTNNAVTTGNISASEALAPFTIANVNPGNYSLRVLQDQSTLVACTAPISSAASVFQVDGPAAQLDTLSVTRKVSYPDLASGSAHLVVNPSGKDPYVARLELTQPSFPGQDFVQDWTDVTFNTKTLNFELEFEHLYAGGYELRIADDLGCEKIYQFSLGTDKTLMIPNIFTPNGDGVNEVFYIRNLPAGAPLVITNRWGKEVYKSNAYTNDWTGGDIVDGVYYYRLGLPSGAVTGWVEILRGQ